jgi:hypothetical protein
MTKQPGIVATIADRLGISFEQAEEMAVAARRHSTNAGTSRSQLSGG